jgi:hypothetical protein
MQIKILIKIDSFLCYRYYNSEADFTHNGWIKQVLQQIFLEKVIFCDKSKNSGYEYIFTYFYNLILIHKYSKYLVYSNSFK